MPVPRDFAERQQYYTDHWSTPYPYSWTKQYNFIIATFHLMRFSKISTVTELGCNDGGLAVTTLRDINYPLSWVGYDFLKEHLERSRYHPNYTSILLDKPLWETPADPFDVFVASHVIEHLYPEDIQRLAGWLQNKAKFLVLASPLGLMSSPDHAEKSGHVLTKGCLWVSDVLQSYGFSPIWETGRWFGWFRQKSQ